MSTRTRIATALLAGLALASGCEAGAPVFEAPDCAAPEADGHEGFDGKGFEAPRERFGLPVLAICADAAALKALDGYTDEASAIEIPVVVDYDGVRYADVEMELHGGFARTVAKKSYRIELEGEGLPFAFDGEADPEPQRHLVLQASWIDPTFLRNDLTFAAIRAVGGLAPRTGYAEVYLNGAPHGLYLVIERIDRRYLDRHALDEDANLYKAVDHRANWLSKANPLAGYEHKVNEDNPTEDLGPFLGALTKTPLDAEAFGEAVEPVLHLDDWTAYQVVHALALNQDAFTKNYYLYHDLTAAPGAPADRFRVISWDADATWGQNWDGAPIDVADWPGHGLGIGVSAWHGKDGFSPRILAIASYRRRYLAFAVAALDGPLSAETLHARATRRAAQVAEAAREDLARWQPQRDFDAELSRLHDAVTTRHEAFRHLVRELREDEDEDD
ncbi:MAG: hypothetical protein EP329_27155 [Deltaproteobacteria bacterium]|nr:MAG: hypothetical protein EP329_27155 [Deltaproteobacteria bacterium]